MLAVKLESNFLQSSDRPFCNSRGKLYSQLSTQATPVILTLLLQASAGNINAQSPAFPCSTRTPQYCAGAVNPIAVGMTPKRFANIRSDFVAAVKASGLAPVKVESKADLSPEWRQLFARLSGRRANLGLSRLGHYASAKGIQPEGVNCPSSEILRQEAA